MCRYNEFWWLSWSTFFTKCTEVITPGKDRSSIQSLFACSNKHQYCCELLSPLFLRHTLQRHWVHVRSRRKRSQQLFLQGRRRRRRPHLYAVPVQHFHRYYSCPCGVTFQDLFNIFSRIRLVHVAHHATRVHVPTGTQPWTWISIQQCMLRYLVCWYHSTEMI